MRTSDAMDKWVKVASMAQRVHLRTGGTRLRIVAVLAHVQYENGRLSITGVEGPRGDGDCWGSSGAIFGRGWPEDYEVYAYAQGLDAIARDWHLNDMRAGCAHQRAAGWDKRPIDPSEPLDAYGTHFPGQYPSWNMLVWVRRDEHPQGLLCEPCPTCGYRYGTRWLRDEVPPEVLAYLEALSAVDAPDGWE